MAAQTTLTGASIEGIIQSLDRETVERFFGQMGSNLSNHLTPNEYQAYLQVITWAVLDRLKATDSVINEDNIKPLVDRTIKPMCTIQEELGYPDTIPSFLLSRVIWWTRTLGGKEFK